MPPPWIRRPVTVSLWLVVSIVFLTLSPVMLALAAVVGAVIRRPQLVVFARLLVAYFLRELATLLACGGLWVASGAGWMMSTRRFQLLHWRLLRWFIHGITAQALSLLGIDEVADPTPEAARALEGERPLIVFSRHAGPGDTLLLVDRLVYGFDRRPSVVFKETLAVEPCVDLIAHRLPHAVLDTEDHDESEAQIERVTAQLGRRGALLLFPEGGNFTPQRWRSAIVNLRRKGRRRAAADAQRMSHVLPPRPTGVLAALRAKPSADVIFAAHTGLGLAAYAREIWQQMPIGKTLRSRMWVVEAAEVPRDPDEQLAWVNTWWSRIDEWIAEQRTE